MEKKKTGRPGGNQGATRKHLYLAWDSSAAPAARKPRSAWRRRVPGRSAMLRKLMGQAYLLEQRAATIEGLPELRDLLVLARACRGKTMTWLGIRFPLVYRGFWYCIAHPNTGEPFIAVNGVAFG